MKKAIITGSTGLLGSYISKYFIDKGIEVLCLGRKFLNDNEINTIFGKKIKYIQLEMKDICNLPEKAAILGWLKSEDCVFFNFAWSGGVSLTSGDFHSQIVNAVNSANAVKVAKKMGCSTFVNAGTLEETFIEQSLNEGVPYTSDQTNYALSKLAARDLCKITSYLEKIDYVHTRLSIPLSPELEKGGYIASTLKLIIKGDKFESPNNKRLFDIICINDVAAAYYAIGKYGKNQSDYFIGTSKPIMLSHFFEDAKLFKQRRNKSTIKKRSYAKDEIFSTEKLKVDTGFCHTIDPLEILFK